MKALAEWIIAVVFGALFGAIILGLVGRLAMAVIALTAGRPTNLSSKGVLEVVLFAALVGAIGGLVRQLSGLWLHTSGVARGVLVGVSLFVLTGMLSWWAGGPPEPGTLALSVPTLLVVAALYVVFGITIEELMRRRDMRSHMDHHSR